MHRPAWILYYLISLVIQIPLGLFYFLILTTIGLVLPEDLDTWVRKGLWLLFFFSGFWGARSSWHLFLGVIGLSQTLSHHLGQDWETKAWL